MMNKTAGAAAGQPPMYYQPRPIYTVVKDALVKRGWRLVRDAPDRPSGEPFEFIHPRTGERLAWTDALLTQHFDLESD